MLAKDGLDLLVLGALVPPDTVASFQVDVDVYVVAAAGVVGEDLSSLLQSASLLECKTFLGAFMRRIEFDTRQVGIEYTAPIPAGAGLNTTAEALGVRESGSRSKRLPYLSQGQAHAYEDLETAPSWCRILV